MEREFITIRNVSELQENGRRFLEEMLGARLRENQQVFIMVVSAGIEPDEAARQQARAGLEESWAAVNQHVQKHGITDGDFNAAVDEAMEHVRHQKP